MRITIRKNTEMLRQFTLISVLLLQIVVFSLLSDRFMTSANLINVLRQISVTAVSAVGMFMIILLGDIDLSVGSIYAFIGVLSAYIFRATESAFITAVSALAIGVIIGLTSGVIIAKGKIPAFVTTLSIMSICRGLAFIFTRGTPIGVSNEKYTVFGSGYVFSIIPVPVIIMLVIFIVGFFLIGYTRFGRYIYACGGNEQAARWSGIKTDTVKILVFSLSGFLFGLSAMILAGRLGGGLPNAGNGAELDVITTVILGGTSLTGGRGKLWGVVIGVIVIGVLSNGLTMLNVSAYWQQVMKGMIILAAVQFDMKANNSGKI